MRDTEGDSACSRTAWRMTLNGSCPRWAQSSWAFKKVVHFFCSSFSPPTSFWGSGAESGGAALDGPAPHLPAPIGRPELSPASTTPSIGSLTANPASRPDNKPCRLEPPGMCAASQKSQIRWLSPQRRSRRPGSKGWLPRRRRPLRGGADGFRD
jgi:hypothetical protein